MQYWHMDFKIWKQAVKQGFNPETTYVFKDLTFKYKPQSRSSTW
jgi:hypothetical protein